MKALLLGIITVLLLLYGCTPSRTPFSQSPTVDNLVLYLDLSWLGDGRLRIRDRATGVDAQLLLVAFSDSNERFVQMGWSPDGQKLGFLIQRSDKTASGCRLMVFDLAGFPQERPRVLVEWEEAVMKFDLSDDRLEYLSASGEWLQQRF